MQISLIPVGLSETCKYLY